MPGRIVSQAARYLIILTILTTAAVLPRPAATQEDEEVLDTYYFHRSPYYERGTDGRPGGFLVEITRLILEEAEVPYRFVEAPPNRILALLKQNVHACSIGWLKNEEREEFAKFSRPIYRDLPLCAVINSEKASRLTPGVNGRQLAQSGLVLGTISGFTYGAWADELTGKHGLKPQVLSVEVEHLLRMIERSRIDYTFMSPEEAHSLIRKHGGLGGRVKVLTLSDAPPGNLRHLMFSRAVEDSTVERIDRAIEKVKASEAYRDLTRFGPD